MAALSEEEQVELLTPQDQDLLTFFHGLERNSLESLEAAARQIITLVTTLAGVFFGILAFKDTPTYLSAGEVKVLGTLTLGALLVALLFALDVVMPRRFDLRRDDLTEMHAILHSLFQTKSRSLTFAQWAFGAGLVFWLLLTLVLLFRF